MYDIEKIEKVIRVNNTKRAKVEIDEEEIFNPLTKNPNGKRSILVEALQSTTIARTNGRPPKEFFKSLQDPLTGKSIRLKTFLEA